LLKNAKRPLSEEGGRFFCALQKESPPDIIFAIIGTIELFFSIFDASKLA
jgi:hypothetical protein